MITKICPIMNASIMYPSPSSEGFQPCREERCQWWTYAYTIEGMPLYDCAMVIGAKKNSEGTIPI